MQARDACCNVCGMHGGNLASSVCATPECALDATAAHASKLREMTLLFTRRMGPRRLQDRCHGDPPAV